MYFYVDECVCVCPAAKNLNISPTVTKTLKEPVLDLKQIWRYGCHKMLNRNNNTFHRKSSSVFSCRVLFSLIHFSPPHPYSLLIYLPLLPFISPPVLHFSLFSSVFLSFPLISSLFQSFMSSLLLISTFLLFLFYLDLLSFSLPSHLFFFTCWRINSYQVMPRRATRHLLSPGATSWDELPPSAYLSVWACALGLFICLDVA